MKDYTLPRERIAELEEFHRSLRDKRQADRVKAVIALSRGWSAAQVVDILLFRRENVPARMPSSSFSTPSCQFSFQSTFPYRNNSDHRR